MAFLLPYRIGCDHEEGCDEEFLVNARSENEANEQAIRYGWQACWSPQTSESPKGWVHYCQEHKL